MYDISEKKIVLELLQLFLKNGKDKFARNLLGGKGSALYMCEIIQNFIEYLKG